MLVTFWIKREPGPKATRLAVNLDRVPKQGELFYFNRESEETRECVRIEKVCQVYDRKWLLDGSEVERYDRYIVYAMPVVTPSWVSQGL